MDRLPVTMRPPRNARRWQPKFIQHCRNMLSVIIPMCGNILAYEVDGYGNQLFMDDANVPSLLALPYLGAITLKDPLYREPRKFALSTANPYFFRGNAAGLGIGGPARGPGLYLADEYHRTGDHTSSNETEITTCLKWLKSTHASTGFMP